MTKKEGYLKVSPIHEIYYHAYGNPKGVPFIVLHGGPGYQSTISSLEHFNLKTDFVILYDQRGSGKSKPFCEIKDHTTDALVQDINLLLSHFKIDKVNILGGSWGTTLALCFAIKNPQKVASLILRGVFLGRQKDIDAIYIPQPEWTTDKKLKHRLTLGSLSSNYGVIDYVNDCFNLIRQGSDKGQQVANLWALYEDLLCSEEGVTEILYSQEDLNICMALSLIETYYFKNKCFMPEDYIISNISKIKHIPTFILHGRHDDVCPIYQAIELAKASGANLVIDETGGHAVASGKMHEKLTEIVNSSRKLFK